MQRLVCLCMMFSFLLFLGCREQSKEQVLQQGIEFLNAGNQPAAISLFKDALEKDPNYLDARLQLGLSYFHLGKFDFAEKELEKAQRQEPSNRDISLHLAKIYLKTNRLDKSLSLLSKMELATPQEAAVLVALAECYALKGDFPSSEEKFRKALITQPDDLDARLGLARLFLATKRLDEGAQLLNDIVADNPTETAPLYVQYQLYLVKADRSNAIAALQRIRTINANDMNAAFLLGLLYLDGGDIDAARKVASDIRVSKPEHPAALRIEGLADYHQGHYKQALLALQKSTSSMQDLGGNYFVGLTFYQLKQYELALSSFQKAIDIRPDHEPSRLMLAQTFLKQSRVDDSLGAAQAVLAINPRSALAHNILGSAYLVQGNYNLAMNHLDKALEIEPNLLQAHVKKGLFNLSTGNLRQGEMDLQQAVAAAPDVLNTRVLLARHYLQVQNYSMVIKTLREGIDPSPDSAIFYNIMAAAFIAQKKDADAIASLNKAKSIKPDYLQPYFNLANYYVSRNDYSAAFKEYQQALQAVPNSLATIVKLAGLYELTGDNDQAAAFYQKASKTGDGSGSLVYAAYLARIGQEEKSLEVLKAGQTANSDNPDLAKALGVALQSRGQFDEAIKHFARLEELAPRTGLPLLIGAYLQKGDVDAANRLASRAIADQPAAEFGYLLQSIIYEHRKEWPAAEQILKRGMAACEHNLSLKMKLASVYSAQGKHIQAIQICDEVLSKQPKNAPVIFAKGVIYESQGNKVKARELYRSATALDENFAPALNNLSNIYLEEPNGQKEALRLAIRAFRNSPEDVSIIDTLGYALLKNGQVKNAVVFLEKAARLRPNDQAIQLHLAQAHNAEGKSVEAKMSLPMGR